MIFYCAVNPDDCPQTTDACGHGTCVDGLDTYTCSCDAGYEGDHCQSESLLVSVLTICSLLSLMITACGNTHVMVTDAVAYVFQPRLTSAPTTHADMARASTASPRTRATAATPATRAVSVRVSQMRPYCHVANFLLLSNTNNRIV